jgi:hypothetical protein
MLVPTESAPAFEAECRPLIYNNKITKVDGDLRTFTQHLIIVGPPHPLVAIIFIQPNEFAVYS